MTKFFPLKFQKVAILTPY